MEYLKTFCCWPCSSGPLSIVASLPQSGFVPGQSIVVTAQINNQSNVPIDYTRFTLRKTIAYHSQIPSAKIKYEVETVQEQRTFGVGTNTNWRREVQLVVPAVPPSNGGQCRLIHVSYEVKVEAKTSGPHQSPFVLLPVTIGTRPLLGGPAQHNFGFAMPQGDCGTNTGGGVPSTHAPVLNAQMPSIMQGADGSSNAIEDMREYSHNLLYEFLIKKTVNLCIMR